MDAPDRQPHEEEPPPTDPPPTAKQPPPAGGRAGRRLVRPRDRVFAGVCSGLARYFEVDVALVRIVAVGAALLGGSGVLLYLAALVLIPAEDATTAAGGPGGGDRTLAVTGMVVVALIASPLLIGGGLALAGIAFPLAFLAGIGLLAWWLASGTTPGGDPGTVARQAALGLSLLAGCGALFLAGAFATGAGGGVAVAGLVIGAGVVLVAGAFLGRVRWLILPALSLALAAGLVSAVGIELKGGYGEEQHRPSSVSQLRDRYELSMGRLVIDLRDTELPPGDTPLDLGVGVGAARLIVPDDVCVASRARVGAGAVDVFDRDNAGLDLDWQDLPTAARNSRVVVDADIGLGALEVRHDDAGSRFDDRRFGPGNGPFGHDQELDGTSSNSGCDLTTSSKGVLFEPAG